MSDGRTRSGERDAHGGLGGNEASEDEFEREEGEREHRACQEEGVEGCLIVSRDAGGRRTVVEERRRGGESRA